ncbi:hypothetical protein J4450_08185 [Candidatus Micrarchaeota archaeon]|nr:hypothetical protein [Candidatus Micrarchaeota archaeon]
MEVKKLRVKGLPSQIFNALKRTARAAVQTFALATPLLSGCGDDCKNEKAPACEASLENTCAVSQLSFLEESAGWDLVLRDSACFNNLDAICYLIMGAYPEGSPAPVEFNAPIHPGNEAQQDIVFILDKNPENAQGIKVTISCNYVGFCDQPHFTSNLNSGEAGLFKIGITRFMLVFDGFSQEDSSRIIFRAGECVYR